jgi:hypothetical protein
MSNHGKHPFSGMDPEVVRRLSQLAGPTGEHVRPKIAEDDEGEFGLVVTAQNGVVRMEFGKPMAWIAFEPKQACELAATLLKIAAEASGDPVTLEIGG